MIPNLQPTLRGTLVELRPLRATDWDALFAVASDPLIWEQHPSANRYQEPIFREFFRIAMDTGMAFAVLDRADGRVIGSTRYHGFDTTKREIEIGWTFLARSHWGGQYNGEMKELLLQHAFQFVDRVLFVIGRHNLRSQRAIERIGGVLLEDASSRDGDNVIYSISAPARD